MNDPSAVDVCHPIATSLRSLVCLEPTLDAINWLHTGRPPNGSEGLFFLATLWRVCRHARPMEPCTGRLRAPWHHHGSCSLLQPRADLIPRGHGFWHMNATMTRRMPASLVPFLALSAPCEAPYVASACAWLSHPMHVAVSPVTSLTTISDPPRVRARCEDPIDEGATRVCVLDTPDGDDTLDPDAEEACMEMACPSLDSDCAGGVTVLRPNDGLGSVDAATEMCTFRPGRAECVRAIGVACTCHGSQGPQARHRAGTTVSQDPHAAHGVGVIVKALVQQNAGASLFLRTIVCVAGLLSCAHAALVLGERPSTSFFGVMGTRTVFNTI